MLKKERASHRLKQLAMFKEVPMLYSRNTKIRTLFPIQKMIIGKRLKRSKEQNITSCLYELGNKGVFSTHIHLTSDET